jgi:hypothetical protein
MDMKGWTKSVAGGTWFRFMPNGTKQILFPAVGSVPALVITECA